MLTRKLQEGQIVRSKAGHDRGTFYVILSWTERDVFVADGIKHTIEQPKRKNKKHVWYTKGVSSLEDNETIKGILSDFVGENA